MSNHPNRNRRYAYISPRGFVNEYVVWRVKAEDLSDVQALIDTYADDTNAVAKWLDGKDPLKSEAVAWEDRRYTSYAGSAWGY